MRIITSLPVLMNSVDLAARSKDYEIPDQTTPVDGM